MVLLQNCVVATLQCAISAISAIWLFAMTCIVYYNKKKFIILRKEQTIHTENNYNVKGCSNTAF